MNDDRLALEQLVIDNPDLERLEALLDEFNIFEVLGAVRVEIRHSGFLSFLMDPQQSHGLGDVFVKKFLQKALVGVDQSGLPVSAIDLNIWSLDDLEVRREWQKIDILLLNEKNKLAVIIENKIGSSEHSNQLQRYHDIVTQHYTDWHILGIYLTPEGEEPSDENYLPVSYDLVSELVEGLVETREATLGPDVHTMMQHYTNMLRRHIVSGSEVEELCRKIYRKHQKALDLIFEYKPDVQADLKVILEQMITETEGLMLDHSSKIYVTFAVEDWDVPTLLKGKGWTPSGRVLLFQFENFIDSVRLKFYIGPGPIEIRQGILDYSLSVGSPFRSNAKLGKKWSTIYLRAFLAAKDYDGTDTEELEIKLRDGWKSFVKNDLEKIKAAMKKLDWIWEEPEEKE